MCLLMPLHLLAARRRNGRDTFEHARVCEHGAPESFRIDFEQIAIAYRRHGGRSRFASQQRHFAEDVAGA